MVTMRTSVGMVMCMLLLIESRCIERLCYDALAIQAQCLSVVLVVGVAAVRGAGAVRGHIVVRLCVVFGRHALNTYHASFRENSERIRVAVFLISSGTLSFLRSKCLFPVVNRRSSLCPLWDPSWQFVSP